MGFGVISEHVRIEAGEEKRIDAAVAALKADSHAPSEITVKLILSVHREYPKHVTVGREVVDGESRAITKIVHSEEEELEALKPAASEPEPEAPEPVDGGTIQ